MKRVLLSESSASIAREQMMRIIGDHPIGRTSTRMNAVMMPRPNFSRISLVGYRVRNVPHIVEPQPVPRQGVTQFPLVVRLSGRDRALKVGEIRFHGVDPSEFVLDYNVDDTVWNLKRHRADFFRRVDAQSPALDHCRSPMPRVDPSVAMITSQSATIAALPAKQRPLTTATIGIKPLSRDNVVNVGVSIAARGAIQSSPPALAEQDQRQPKAMREFEDAVLLVVVPVTCVPASTV